MLRSCSVMLRCRLKDCEELWSTVLSVAVWWHCHCLSAAYILPRWTVATTRSTALPPLPIRSHRTAAAVSAAIGQAGKAVCLLAIVPVERVLSASIRQGMILNGEREREREWEYPFSREVALYRQLCACLPSTLSLIFSHYLAHLSLTLPGNEYTRH